MSIETVARQTLYRQTHARGGDLRSLANRALLGRIWRFAGRHHRRLRAFVLVSVVSALSPSRRPVLAGKVVDQIVGGGDAGRGCRAGRRHRRWWRSPRAAVSLGTRWLSSNIGEGLILDLRTAVFDHVQRCRSRSSPAPAPARWSAASATT